MREHESFLSRLEETLSRMSGWLAARRRSGEQARHARIEALRADVAEARHAIAETTRADLARVRAGVDDLKRDYDAQPGHSALTHVELEAFRRHLHTTARLLRDLSDIDRPAWEQATEEYERSWAETQRAFESEGASAPP